MHPDAADRILVATALHLKATLVTADEHLLRYSTAGHLHCLPAA
jgi:PIN domain nuclease of toxin-antitoxin system